jgi:DNA-binding transcriptional LysR family regulator
MHSIRQFELVKALATYRHFGRVTAALGVSQPALTRSLKHLEVRLGVPLFDRQGVMPTVFGQLVLTHGEAVIKGFADLVREINLPKAWKSASSTSLRGRIPPKFRGSAQSACFPRSIPGFLSSSSSSTGRKSSIRC